MRPAHEQRINNYAATFRSKKLGETFNYYVRVGRNRYPMWDLEEAARRGGKSFRVNQLPDSGRIMLCFEVTVLERKTAL